MAQAQCPSCGAALPGEMGQHSVAPLTGRATCPSCGAEVNIPKEGGDTGQATVSGTGEVDRAASSGPDSGDTFSGSETMEGVKEELESKPGGGEAT